MAHHNTTGKLGEQMAFKYLSEKGFVVLHQNWRHGNWEIDMIAEFENTLHFIEVKTRRTRKFGYPEEDVSRKKLNNLINASEEFLYLYPNWKRIQFDILSINLARNEPAEFFFIEDVHTNN